MKSLLKALGDKHNPGTGKGCEARRVHVSTGGTHGLKSIPIANVWNINNEIEM